MKCAKTEKVKRVSNLSKLLWILLALCLPLLGFIFGIKMCIGDNSGVSKKGLGFTLLITSVLGCFLTYAVLLIIVWY